MNVNFSNLNFGAKYINTTQIKKYDYFEQKYFPMQVSFVEMEPANKSDREALYDLLAEWKECEFVAPIVDSFEYLSNEDNKVYALTLQGRDFDKLKSSEIVGLANMDITKGNIPELSFLQVDPDLLHKKESPVYKNVGTGIINSLKQIYNKAIQLVSMYSVTEFYVKNGFEIVDKKQLRYIWRV